MGSIFIADGFTLTAPVKDIPGLVPGFTITYRPAAPVTRARYTEAPGPDARVKEACKIAAEQVQALTVAGESIKPTADQWAQLHAAQFSQVLDYVLGYEFPKGCEGGEKNLLGG